MCDAAALLLRDLFRREPDRFAAAPDRDGVAGPLVLEQGFPYRQPQGPLDRAPVSHQLLDGLWRLRPPPLRPARALGQPLSTRPGCRLSHGDRLLPTRPAVAGPANYHTSAKTWRVAGKIERSCEFR